MTLPVWLFGPVRVRLLGVLALAAVLTTGCAGSRGDAEDPARLNAAANQRLIGSWMLVDFQPAVPLEPMLAQLLSVQMGHLSAAFDGGRVNVAGVGVQATRTYRIDEASMDRFKMTLFDETGVPYETWGNFQGDVVRFESVTPPWAGQGSFRRVATQ